MTEKMPREKLIETSVLGKYPHYFSTPIFVMDQDHRINSGTLTLLAGQNDAIIGLTCWHIIEEYVNQVEQGKQLSFYIGSVLIDPREILIDYDKELDLATLILNKDMQTAFRSKSFPDMGSQLITTLYQKEVQTGDTVTLGGLPGGWVQNLRFETFSIVNCKVHSSSANSYSCTVHDSNNWPVIQDDVYRSRTPKDLLSPGGLSGGPVFIECVNEWGLVCYELAGIIYEGNYIMNSPTLVLLICPAKFVNYNGSIQRDFAAHCSL